LIIQLNDSRNPGRGFSGRTELVLEEISRSRENGESDDQTAQPGKAIDIFGKSQGFEQRAGRCSDVTALQPEPEFEKHNGTAIGETGLLRLATHSKNFFLPA